MRKEFQAASRRQQEQDRAQVGELAEKVQQITGEPVELAYVDQGDTVEAAEEAAAEHGIRLQGVKHTEAKRGFVLLPGILVGAWSRLLLWPKPGWSSLEALFGSTGGRRAGTRMAVPNECSASHPNERLDAEKGSCMPLAR